MSDIMIDIEADARPFRLPPCRFKGAVNENAKHFLYQLNCYIKVTRTSDQDILNLLPFIFSGSALTWFNQVGHSISSYEHFVYLFQQQFLNTEHQGNLRVEILQRKQNSQEKIYDYILNVVDLNQRLGEPFVERDLVNIIRANMLPLYALTLSPLVCPDLVTLQREARRIQELHYNIASQIPTSFHQSSMLGPVVPGHIYRGMSTRYPREESTGIIVRSPRPLGRRTSTSFPGQLRLPPPRPATATWRAQQPRQQQSTVSQVRTPQSNFTGCFVCGDSNHWQRNCPMRTGNGEGNS